MYNIIMTSRRQKIMQACENLYDLMKKHEEWDSDNEKYWNKKMVEISKGTDGMVFIMFVTFERGGCEIFSPRCGVEDDDHPDLVGEDILNNMAKRAAKMAGLRLNNTVAPVFYANEKGSLSAGFERLDKKQP